MISKKYIEAIIDNGVNAALPLTIVIVINFLYSIEVLGKYTLFTTIVMLLRTLNQGFVLSTLSVIKNNIKYKRDNKLIKKINTFEMQISFLLIMLGLLIATLENFNIFWLMIYLAFDNYRYFQRSIFYLEGNYTNNIVSSIVNLTVFLLCIVIFQYVNYEPINVIFFSLTLSTLIANLYVYKIQKIEICKVNNNFYRYLFIKGKAQTQILFTSWVRSAGLIYILSYSYTMTEVGKYRILQVAYSVYLVMVSSLESFYPQRITSIKNKQERLGYINKSRKIIVIILSLLLILNYLICIYLYEILNVTKLELLIYAMICYLTMSISILNIYFRAEKRLERVKKVYLTEMFFSVSILFVVSLYLSFDYFLIYRFIITFLLLLYLITVFKKIKNENYTSSCR